MIPHPALGEIELILAPPLGHEAVFLLGQVVGLVAQIPAGLGVFEAVMLVGLTPALSTPAILVGLVGYRLVYFVLPLVLATGIWVLREGRRWVRAIR